MPCMPMASSLLVLLTISGRGGDVLLSAPKELTKELGTD